MKRALYKTNTIVKELLYPVKTYETMKSDIIINIAFKAERGRTTEAGRRQAQNTRGRVDQCFFNRGVSIVIEAAKDFRGTAKNCF